MEYQVIDETIGLYACSVADLTSEQVQTFNNQNPGQDIKDFTIFFDHDRQAIVINREHGYYGMYLAILQEYAELNKEQRKKLLVTLAERKEPKSLIKICIMINIAMEERELRNSNILLAERASESWKN